MADQVDDISFVFEIAIAETELSGRLATGVNFLPTFEDPFARTRLACKEASGYGLVGLLQAAHADPPSRYWAAPHGRNVAVAAHLIWPGVEVLDRGKTRLMIPQEMAK